MFYNKLKTDAVAEAVAKVLAVDEQLKGNQHKIDANKNGKVDAQDFEILRKKKEMKKEETEPVEEGWDDMLKAVKDKNKPQPSGGSGIKKGTRYGGSKQKDEPEKDDEDKMKKEEVEQVDEVSPPGFKGTVKAMKKHKEIDNPFALAWYMKKKGYKSHKKEDGTMKKEEVENEEDFLDLDEAVSRKHFQQVADVIKAHPDQEKRNELAKHHADIFKKQNPRFDHGRFYTAAGANIKD